MTLPKVPLDASQSRTFALAKFAHSLAHDLADICRFGDPELLGLENAWIFVRGLTLVEDLEHIAALDGDLQVLGDFLLVEIVMLPYCVTYPLDAWPLFLTANLPDRV